MIQKLGFVFCVRSRPEKNNLPNQQDEPSEPPRRRESCQSWDDFWPSLNQEATEWADASYKVRLGLWLTIQKLAFLVRSGMCRPEKTHFFRDPLILTLDSKFSVFGDFWQVAICKKHNFSHFDWRLRKWQFWSLPACPDLRTLIFSPKPPF